MTSMAQVPAAADGQFKFADGKEYLVQEKQVTHEQAGQAGDEQDRHYGFEAKIMRVFQEHGHNDATHQQRAHSSQQDGPLDRPLTLQEYTYFVPEFGCTHRRIEAGVGPLLQPALTVHNA